MKPLQKIEAFVVQAWRELVASSESVSTWKVSQSALVKLEAESWDSLGYKPQQVPSLQRLIGIEGRVNSFIHCFVAVQTITSLYDLEVAICENEGIKKFEELELGPLLRHPLAEDYFSSEDMTEICKITSEEFIDYLKKFIMKLNGESFQGSELLEFVAMKCKVSSWEKMGLRIQGLWKHVGCVRAALRREKSVFRTCFQNVKDSGNKSQKQPLPLTREQMDESYNVLTHHTTSFPSAHKDFTGKDKYGSEQIVYHGNKQKECLSSQHKASDEVSSFLYPSDAADMVQLGLRGETDSSFPTGILKNTEKNERAKNTKRKSKSIENNTYLKTGKGLSGDALSDDSIRMFISTWKEKCCQLTATEVFQEMTEFCDLTLKRKKQFMRFSAQKPFLELLNVAVLSIKNGSWDNIYDMPQSFDEHGCRNAQSNKSGEYECTDVGSSREDLLGSTDPLPGSGLSVTIEVISCPYPSEAADMVHLGLRGETDSSFPTGILKNIEKNERAKKSKRNGKSIENKTYLKTGKGPSGKSLSDDSIRMFISTWKEKCCQLTATEVFQEMMGFCDLTLKRKRKLMILAAQKPFLELLNVAVLSIKNGSWDNIYDMSQSFDEHGCRNAQSNKSGEYECKDVGSSREDLLGSTDPLPGSGLSVTIEDIVKKVREYFANEVTLSTDGETVLVLARKLLHCEVWLSQQYSVEEFSSLGFGEYLTFLERHVSLLSKELHDNYNGQVHDQFSFEVNLHKPQLIALLSQASDSLWVNGIITKQRISSLLSQQYPFIDLKVVEKGGLDNVLHTIKEHKSSSASNCLLFSATLLETYDSGDTEDNIAKDSLDCTGLDAKTCRKVGNVGSVTTKDAVEVLLRAPMLIDLNSWLQWDIAYAPSLGPLLTWLLTEVNAKDLLCLLSRDGKIMKIGPSASVDSFYKALLKGSPFHVSVELLSLFALCGGRRHLPLSLLKCRARQAFEVLLTNPTDGGQGNGNSGFTSGAGISMKQNDVNEATSHASRLVLDCLGYFPSEFYSLAADILLSGLQSVDKYAPSSVLLQCRSTQEHLMLHEVGFTLGVTEWINDHQKVCPIIPDQSSMLISVGPLGSLGSKAEFEYQQQQQATGKMLLPKEILSSKNNGEYEGQPNLNSSVGGLETDSIQDALQVQVGGMEDAAHVIESIRCEEFGLDSDVESGMLKKQHARLGRALHCLSQELYSQDSHFLLELIQNADDNAYGMEVEPTLVFVLQNSRIIVLNNELGFTAQNIRALCDVGNSTKRGSSTGYIGQKGIGFKSVFRVTDAPEIHSNGFHIKFDITEGRIGFVLPTVVPPCNIDVIRQLASAYPDQISSNGWNTCTVLPLRSTQGLEMGKIISMFSDIHPSLLLFIRRLRCMKLINMLDNSFYAMRKEILGNGLVKVTYGENAMTWFIASKKLFPEIIRPGVQATEISIAITLKECENGNYESHLEQQPVFAFLPLRMYGLKFILQGDFVLPSSREEVDGDSLWNQWLLSEFPDLFVSAEKQFCALPCFRENPGEAVTSYLHFVPLIGEVQGFFSGLPRMIISRLRQSDCLLQEGCNKVWVPPCRVLRNWNEQACMLLPDVLLQQHLGLVFLHKDVILSDQLAWALSIQDYGPKILVQFISSICSAENGLKSMGFHWLSSWLSELYNMLDSERRIFGKASLELDLIDSLKRVRCVPLSNGEYGSINEGTVWLNTNSITTGSDCSIDTISFPKLYASMRIVNPCLFSASSDDAPCMDDNFVNNVASMLHKIGVQHLTAHEMIITHILPVISDIKIAIQDKSLFIECNAFVMLHLQSSCADCRVEKENIISEFRSKALLLTNLGFKRLSEATVHFGKDFGSPIDASKFIGGMDYEWNEIDVLYLKYPLTESAACGLIKWREFFHGLGVTDFVEVTQVQRKISGISPTVFQQVKWDRNLISSSLLISDWESQELNCMLSLLDRNGSQESEMSKYLLEVLDILWDDYFSDKTACCFSCKSGENVTSFKSSLMINICDVRWVTSSVDDEFHYPRELFYDCDDVRSILGSCAPYAVPKISNSKLLNDIGFKTQVTIDDILASFRKWITLDPFKASVSQMSRLYTFISKEPDNSKKKAVEALRSGPFIFVPHDSGVSPEDVVVGSLFSPEEVYWHDNSGVLDSMKKLSSSTPNFPVGKALCDIYPGLRDFFVEDCGVSEAPPFRYLLHILKQLSLNTTLHAASSVFKVFLMLSDGLQCGSMADADIIFFRDQLLQLDFTVLPTVRDTWVSLHPSFGILCWSGDDSSINQFKHSDSIQFLNFGKLTDHEKKMLRTKVSVIMQKLGIPALSEIMTREVIYYGPLDSSYKASLVEWALPFAQRYIYTVHKKKYTKLKMSEFEKLCTLKIVVVEKLLFHNVVKNCDASSKQRSECSCLLQDTVLYITRESDSHSLFMELSRLFFNGAPELPLANFLHMLATMAESGSTKEQVELFILNSQKMPKFPNEEPVWSLSSPFKAKDENMFSCWPPVGWKTARRGMTAEQGCTETETNMKARETTPMEISEDFITEDQPNPASQQAESSDAFLTSVIFESHSPEESTLKSNKANNDPGAISAGRLGELIAFQHLKGKNATASVNWVNEKKETGLPYDIVIGEETSNKEYIEVKATRYGSKNWFNISTNEWQFAVEKGDCYSIVRVVASNKGAAKVTVYKNPVRLCQQGKLELAVMVPRQQKSEASVVLPL